MASRFSRFPDPDPAPIRTRERWIHHVEDLEDAPKCGAFGEAVSPRWKNVTCPACLALPHETDEQCFAAGQDERGVCRVCQVGPFGGDPCFDCGGVLHHRPTCPEIDEPATSRPSYLIAVLRPAPLGSVVVADDFVSRTEAIEAARKLWQSEPVNRVYVNRGEDGECIAMFPAPDLPWARSSNVIHPAPSLARA